ncbi:MAG: hypothetical protein ACLVKR_07755 [Lachnospiraceae bacterium]
MKFIPTIMSVTVEIPRYPDGDSDLKISGQRSFHSASRGRQI